MSHAESNKLFIAYQSAYQHYHSTETAATLVHNDLVHAVDSGRVSALVLLDLSSAFDTIDHTVLLSILENRFSVHRVPLDCFRSYLKDRWQTFCTSGLQSAVFAFDCSVPQDSTVTVRVSTDTHTHMLRRKTILLSVLCYML